MQCKPEMNRKRFVASANFQFSIFNFQFSILNSQLSYLRILLRRVEARTVLADIRAELAVAQDAGVRIVRLQLAEQIEERTLLGVGAGVGRPALLVQTAFVADADAMVVPAGGMGTDVMDGTATVYLAVAGDIEVVANLSKTTLQVATAQSLDREIDIATRRAAMDYQEADLPVVLVEAAGYHPAQALTPKAPAMALATAMITLRTMPHTVLGFFSICE